MRQLLNHLIQLELMKTESDGFRRVNKFLVQGVKIPTHYSTVILQRETSPVFYGHVHAAT